ncbi:MAG: hypothetical protein JJE52_18565 [Acidimicrobiia bacterium]|nr:hypothetical protein [Acidimicrobiia bacterium]
MTDLDLSSMQPGDAVVAARSLPRRFRDSARSAVVEMGSEPGDSRVDEVAARTGPDGYSGLDILQAAAEHLGRAQDVLGRALVDSSTSIPAELVDQRPVIEHRDGAGLLDEEVQRVAAAAERLAEQIDGADARRWETTLAVTDGTTTTPLHLVRQVIATNVLWLRDLERTLRAVRGHPQG